MNDEIKISIGCEFGQHDDVIKLLGKLIGCIVGGQMVTGYHMSYMGGSYKGSLSMRPCRNIYINGVPVYPELSPVDPVRLLLEDEEVAYREN